MNKCGKEIILPCRRIKDNLHRHSGEEEVEYCCPHCKVWAVHSDFQRTLDRRDEWRVALSHRNLKNITSDWWSRLISAVISHVIIYSWYDMMRIVLFLWGLSPQIPEPHHNKGKRQKNISRETFFRISVLLQTVKVAKNKESMGNWESRKEPKRQLGEKWYFTWDLGRSKTIWIIIDYNVYNYIIICQYWLINCNKATWVM